MPNFDLIIIGAGPAGLAAAAAAAARKKSVLLVERDDLGGTCLNRGCIPTKALLRAARLYREAHNSAELGLSIPEAGYDMAALSRHAAEVQSTLREGSRAALVRAGVQILHASAVVTGERRIEAGGETFGFERLLVACGSHPAVPPIPGAEGPGVLTSDDLLNGVGVDVRSLTIIGGGVIGAEFAQFYSDLGAKVTIVEALPRLLSNLEREFGQSLQMSFKKRGIDVFTGASVSSITRRDDALVCEFADKNGKNAVGSQAVLICTGRRPCTDGLFSAGLVQALGLQRGYLPVDPVSRETRVPGIYAAGDAVLGGVQLAHAAQAQALNAVAAMYGDAPVKDLSLVPSCIFTQPELASVGLTTDEAKEQGIPFKTRKSLTSANGKSVLEGAERGFAKLVYHAETGRLLGAQLMCGHASEQIGLLGAAIRAGMTLAELDGTIFPHPTVSEILPG